MQSEAQSIRFLVINSASGGIDRGISCNFIFFSHSDLKNFHFVNSFHHFQSDDVIKICVNVSDLTQTTNQQLEVSL